MNIENTSCLLLNMEKIWDNISFTEYLTLTQDSNNFSNITNVVMTELYGKIVISSLGVFTNILVAATISVTWKFWRHSLGILLLILACVDIIGNAVFFIFYLFKIYQFMSYPIFFQPFLYLNNGFKRLSYLMMIPISANRYALICKPFTHHVITSKKSTLIQITTLTVFAFSAGIFELYLHRMNWIVYNMCLLIINSVMSAVLPLIISFILTSLVICEFRRINRTLNGSVSTGADSRQGERNLTRSMIAVNVAFITLTLPPTVLRVIWFMYFHSLINNIYYITVFHWLARISDINFSVNIFIYTMCLPKFRSTLLGFFTCTVAGRGEMSQLQWQYCKV